ncbi:MAG: hypothetical protein JW774_06810, partial [Candidatus Aureabacteria bacterium]|nr:hypothetical protein [Candidatus Auribacterota bacterium]
SVLLANAIETALHPEWSYARPSSKGLVFLMLVWLFCLWIFSVHTSRISSFIGTGFGILMVFFFLRWGHSQRFLLPHGSFYFITVLPAVYAALIRYFELLYHSRMLIRLSSIEPLTRLYTFRYFYSLLHRSYIRQNKKKRGLYLFAFELRSIKTGIDVNEMSPLFFKEMGDVVQKTDSNIFACFSANENICFIAFQRKKDEDLSRRLLGLRETLLKKISSFELPVELRFAGVDMESAHVSSSVQMVQILKSMLKQNVQQTGGSFEDYQPSLVVSSLTHETEPDFTDNDLDFVSLQISEDKKDLNQMRKQLTRSIREYSMAQRLSAMGQLSSYYAHELKNPLHNLLNCFEVIDDPNESEESRSETKKIMKSEIQRVIQLTERMGGYFKPSVEKTEELNLNQIISFTHAFLERKLKDAGIEVVMELDPLLPAIMGIKDQFKQVLLNLFLNAVEAMPKGGHLIVASFYVSPLIRITITDTGVGIQSFDQEKIFEAFFTTKKEKGTGLGLFVCYNVIHHHGGTIKVRSTPGKGSCFEIVIPT